MLSFKEFLAEGNKSKALEQIENSDTTLTVLRGF